MANTITSFLETLVAKSGEFNAATVGRRAFVDAVYRNLGTDAARAGHTVKIPFPDVGAFTDGGVADLSPEDINPTSVDVVFDQHPTKAILIRDFEQWQTEVNILDQFIDPMYKRGQEYINGLLAALITPTNFPQQIIGTSNALVTVADAANAWDTLAGNKVPVDDVENLAIVTHNTVHRNMLTNTDWSQESLVGAMIAERARRAADLGVAFNFAKLWDQQAPKNTTALAGTVAATNGSGTITGTTTAFDTALVVGDRITIADDTSSTVYRVTAIASATSMTVTPVFGGSNVTGKVATQQSYTALAFHRHAIALGLRPLNLVNDGTTRSTIIVLRGIPFRVMISYQHRSLGHLLSVDCGCAVKVIRPTFGVRIKV